MRIYHWPFPESTRAYALGDFIVFADSREQAEQLVRQDRQAYYESLYGVDEEYVQEKMAVVEHDLAQQPIVTETAKAFIIMGSD